MSSDSICSLLQVRVEIDFTMHSEQNICLVVSEVTVNVLRVAAHRSFMYLTKTICVLSGKSLFRLLCHFNLKVHLIK